MNISFYKFSKRPNSTAVPGAASEPYIVACTLTGSCSILSPFLRLERSPEVLNIWEYNYCYIPDFGRYYFITDWVTTATMWEASLSCDVLGSYKNAIGNSNLYVMRAAQLSVVNGNIADAEYPSQSIPQKGSTVISKPWTESVSGSYVMAVTSGGTFSPGLPVGTTKYIVLDDTTMRKTAQMLTSDLWFDENDSMFSGDIDAATFKAIFNPSQYIHQIMYFPFSIPAGTYSHGSLWLGWYKVVAQDTANGIDFKGLDTKLLTFTQTISIPKHPQSATRGNYLNSAPFSYYALDMQPFGRIMLDASLFAGADYLTLDTTIDCLTGVADVYVMNGSTIVASTTGQVGIPVTLNQISVDRAAKILNDNMMMNTKINTAIGAGNIIMSAVGSAASGNYLGAAVGSVLDSASLAMSTHQSLEQGIYNGLQLSAAHLSGAGSSGTWLYTYRDWRLQHFFNLLVAEDIEHHGRPVYQKLQLNTLSGFIKVQDGDISLSCTNAEKAQIKALLESGFYYE